MRCALYGSEFDLLFKFCVGIRLRNRLLALDPIECISFEVRNPHCKFAKCTLYPTLLHSSFSSFLIAIVFFFRRGLSDSLRRAPGVNSATHHEEQASQDDYRSNAKHDLGDQHNVGNASVIMML